MNNLPTLLEKLFPVKPGTSLVYNKQANIFLTPVYVSAAGNGYQQGFRRGNALTIEIAIGHGWAHDFCNGITLYSNDGHKLKTMMHQSYCNFWYNEQSIYAEVKRILVNFVKSQAKLMNLTFLEQDKFDDGIEMLIQDAYSNNINGLLCK